MSIDFAFWNNPYWAPLMFTIGEITVFVILGALVVSLTLVIISIYSIRRKRLYFCLLYTSDAADE